MPPHAEAAIEDYPQPERPATGAQLLVNSLSRLGVELVFGYPGGAIMPVYDALVDAPLRHILTRHEQAAIFAADAWARITGNPGVCMATSGPGATNLVTGLANAFMDSVPLIAITGQVATDLMGTDAFQETDTFGITMPVVKHSYIVRDAGDIPGILEEAFHIARTGRPGPVLIDLPKDVSVSTVAATPQTPRPVKSAAAPAGKALAAARNLLAEARKPLLYVGGGVALAGAVQGLRTFEADMAIPSVATLKGLGSLLPDTELFLGMLGMHGTRAANLAVQECDLLICCGARFDDRATGKLSAFAPGAKVIHLDADEAEIGKLRSADVALPGDLKQALNGLRGPVPEIDCWRSHVRMLKERHAFRYDAPGDGVYAPRFLKRLSEAAGDRFVAACDVGQHQMWVAQHCRFSRPEAHLTSGGLGAMGYGLPAAIGARLAEPDAIVCAVSGDGSIMMNIQELATLKRYGIPVKIVLLDNGSLGLVRQWQELFFDNRYSETDLSDNPDFSQVARAFGIEAFTISQAREEEAAIERLLCATGPILAHVKIDPRANVWPLVPPGKSNSEMMEG